MTRYHRRQYGGVRFLITSYVLSAVVLTRKTPTANATDSTASVTKNNLFDTDTTTESNEKWSFNVLADWHNAESFARNPGRDTKGWKLKYDLIRYMYETYGGDLVLLPGDSNDGHWHKDKFAENFLTSATKKERVLEAGRNCYGTMKDLFTEAGYNIILMAIGDHELGDNPWNMKPIKEGTLPEFRQGFTEGFNRMPKTGEYIFKKPIGSEPCRPVGTDFKDTSYAYQHKNVLFITVDVYFQMPKNYFDREKGLGGEGQVTCTMNGDHLSWFENVLIEARKDNTVKHIIVQAHVPVLQPVRKVNSSGQIMDYGEDSEFWQTMVKYKVDAYFAGEVHATTVTKDTSSNLLQIVSRGNSMDNFLKVEVTDSTLEITAYNEIGPKPKYNMNYTVHGSLLLDKVVESTVESTFTTSPRVQLSTVIHSSGILKLVDTASALIHFNFGKTIPLRKRQVIGMKNDEGLNVKSITVRGRKCSDSLPNKGSFGQQYDAQVVELKRGKPGVKSPHYAKFSEDSRLGIYSFGPHAAGGVISFAVWFKTTDTREMIIVHYGACWGVGGAKDMFTLTLRNGSPVLYSYTDTFVKPSNKYYLNDDQWHHVAISMPRKSCRLSELIIYINGKAVDTITTNDENLFFDTTGRTSIGGFGYSAPFETVFPNLKPFIGGIDEFYLWSKPLEYKDLQLAMRRKFHLKDDTLCEKEGIPHKVVDVVYKLQCKRKCKKDIDCWGFQGSQENGIHKCIHFQERPKSYDGEKTENAFCGISV